MRPSRRPFVVPLSDEVAEQVELTGGKAATLAKLTRAGYRVPRGVVLTTSAFASFIDQGGLRPDATREQILAAALPEDVLLALDGALATLGDVSLAVRSSAVDEDRADASFAGLYATELGIRGANALREAIHGCWASSYDERVRTYARRRGETATPPMAILIQHMVDADSAGVSFSANPVTGDRGETVVNAVRGVGEPLVAGTVTPDEWLVRDGVATCRAASHGSIDAGQAVAVASLARRLEAMLGAPQDVEWAIARGSVFLLQSRPITTLPEQPIEPIPVPIEPPVGYWQREATHAPQPWSPMQRSMFMTMREDATKHWCDDFGLLFDHIEFREIGGWEYVRIAPMGGGDAPMPPTWLMWLLVRLLPSLRTRVGQCVDAIRSDRAGALVSRWYDEWQPWLERHNARIGAIDVAVLSDDALLEHIAGVVEHLSTGVEIHARLHGAEMIAMAELAFACRDLLAWDETRSFALLTGLSTQSTEPARELGELASLVRSRPSVRALIERADREAVAGLADVDAEVADAFALYMRAHGGRALRYEVADPTLAETPELVLSLVRDQLARPYDAGGVDAAQERSRDALIETARGELRGRPEPERERFEAALSRAARAYPVREGSEVHTVSVPIAWLRRALLEVGARLARRGATDAREDVFFLELEEARAALRTGEEQRSLLRRRKGERAWVLANPGPQSYGKEPGAPPTFTALPSEARFAHEALMWVTDSNGTTGRSESTALLRSHARHRRIAGSVFRPRARGHGRVAVREAPSRRRVGLPHHVARVVGVVPEHRRARHRHRRNPRALRNHRPRVRDPSGRRDGNRDGDAPRRTDGDRGRCGRDGGNPRQRARGSA